MARLFSWVASRAGSPTHSTAAIPKPIDTTDAALNALRGQAYDFLPKPIEPGDLLRKVEDLLRARVPRPVSAA